MIYVVDVDHMSPAFAAGSETQAAQISRSPRFARAIGRSHLGNHPRVATVWEHLAFHDMAVEFADAAADILVARVG